ncbi:Os07g0595100 [Oryza sativa Japonica Group]|uniref:Os07g0595100 protein n=1 Tax=Oryza sativa subsp. japonica TaxID=39947 RepID=A0A0P0X8F5_ORYSJ|nr:hypothetical protein EE612_040434 [Oryza sativa]BAT02467.1 Os07g0595100 [Oryza sativa Japonica Group]
MSYCPRHLSLCRDSQLDCCAPSDPAPATAQAYAGCRHVAASAAAANDDDDDDGVHPIEVWGEVTPNLTMDAEGTRLLNLTVLQRLDPAVKDILTSTSTNE